MQQTQLPGIEQEQPKKRRHRFQFKFWLDINREDEAALAGELEDLKDRRQFAPTLRNALKIFLSLKRGDLKLLVQFFPWVEEHFRAKYQTSESPANEEFAAMLRRIEEQISKQGSLERAAVATQRKQLGSSKTLKSKVSVSQSDAGADDVAANLLGSLANF